MNFRKNQKSFVVVLQRKEKCAAGAILCEISHSKKLHILLHISVCVRACGFVIESES